MYYREIIQSYKAPSTRFTHLHSKFRCIDVRLVGKKIRMKWPTQNLTFLTDTLREYVEEKA